MDIPAVRNTSTIDVKYFTKSLLEDTNTKARNEGRVYHLDPDTISELSSANRYPISWHAARDDFVLTKVMLDEGTECWLNLTFEEWRDLPVAQVIS